MSLYSIFLIKWRCDSYTKIVTLLIFVVQKNVDILAEFLKDFNTMLKIEMYI